MNKQNQESNLSELGDQLLTQLQSQNYSHSTLACYKSGITKISRYMQANDINMYTKEIGANFFQEWNQQKNNLSLRWHNYVRTIINRLNDVLVGKSYVCMHSSRNLIYPVIFYFQLDNYLAFMRKAGNRESTINVRRVYCSQFLCSLESQGLTSLSELQPRHIYNAFITISSKEGFCEKIPKFLDYLYREHLLDKELYKNKLNS